MALFWMVTMLLANAQTVPLIIAHRGGSEEFPENSIPAFSAALGAGVDGIEADFRVTRDGQVVCIHDKDTGRVAGQKHIVADSSLSELRRLTLKSTSSVQTNAVRIPTLAEVIKIVPQGRTLFLEIKSGPTTLVPVQEAVRGAGGGGTRLNVLSFDEEVVRMLRPLLPEAERTLLVGLEYDRQTHSWSPSAEEVVRRARGCDAQGVDVPAVEAVDGAFIRTVRESGLVVHVWQVNDAQSARAYAKRGVASITTDRPDIVRKAFEEEK